MKSIVFRLMAVFSVALIILVPMPSKADDRQRLTVVVSDLHFGIGRDSNGTWDPVEDFRWYKALQGFLEHISQKGNENVDLIIAGDFLELWQLPPDINCLGKAPDLGCSIPEVKQLISRVIKAHSDEIAAIAAFAGQGSNRVYVIPGNHDAALVLPEAWALLVGALNVEDDRVSLVKDGLWLSSDGQVLIEHGHQIGSDANRFSDWPQVTAVGKDGREYLIRPWGELFVQRMFNDEEKTYPIIDNLSPESAGIKYRMGDRGVWRSANDIARFVAFNLFHTSFTQKGASLGQPGGGEKGDVKCSVEEGRALGYRLFVEALPWDDPFRDQIEANDEEAKEVQKELDILANKLPAEDIAQLCAQRSKATLGALFEQKFVPRKKVLQQHLDKRLEKYSNTSVFIYGHTHQLEEAWDVPMEKYNRNVSVLNSGAFQRLVDESGYLARLDHADKDEPWKGLRKIGIENLPPCYSAVFVRYSQEKPSAEVKLWYMPEDGTGQVRSPGSNVCQ